MNILIFNLLLLTLLLATPAAFAQTAQPGQTAPSAEPPIKAVPQAGHQAKPQPVDLPNGPDHDGPDHGGPNHARHAADRATRRAAHHGPGHGLGGHGRHH